MMALAGCLLLPSNLHISLNTLTQILHAPVHHASMVVHAEMSVVHRFNVLVHWDFQATDVNLKVKKLSIFVHFPSVKICHKIIIRNSDSTKFPHVSHSFSLFLLLLLLLLHIALSSPILIVGSSKQSDFTIIVMDVT
jgi:hypothetical protein